MFRDFGTDTVFVAFNEQSANPDADGFWSEDLFSRERISCIGIIETNWQRTRPQETESNSAKRIWALETTGWSEQQRKAFQTICGAEMTAYGYTLDTGYRAAITR
jgi:hypothetical protein